MHPAAGSTPYRIAQSSALTGCNALAVLPDDSVSAAAFSSNGNPLVSASGVVAAPFSSDTFTNPWGEAFVGATSARAAAIYVSNIGGTIDRIALTGDTQSVFTEIAKGFCGSGAPGALFGIATAVDAQGRQIIYFNDDNTNTVMKLSL